MKILREFGFDVNRAAMVPNDSFRMLSHKGEEMMNELFNYKERFGEDEWSGKRSDLRGELFRLATAPSEQLRIQGQPARVIPNAPVVGVDPAEGSVTLEDGSIFEADVVISKSRHCNPGLAGSKSCQDHQSTDAHGK